MRIPREFELPGREVFIRKEGRRLIVEPVEKGSLLELLKTLRPVEEELPPLPDLPPDPVEF